ncbi:hypothetical protein SDRG_16962, partial [Saprolegnia diclina VS20]
MTRRQRLGAVLVALAVMGDAHQSRALGLFKRMPKQRLLPQTTIDTYGGDKFKSPDLHSVSLCDLPSGATVEYCVGSFASTFLVPPSPGDDATPTVLGLVGDVGDTAQDDLNALDKYQALRPHAILVAGDWPYADGKRAKWGKWFELQEATFATISVTGIDGNHKVLTADENYKAYLRRVPGPLSDASKKALRPYYSLAIGLVHAVFLDDYIGATAKFGGNNWRHERDRQLTWLQEDLMAVNRSTTPYVLVIKYNPFYNSFRGHQCVCGATPLEIDNVASCWVSDYNTYQEGALLRSPSQARRSMQCHRGPSPDVSPFHHARKLQVLWFNNHDLQTPRDSYVLLAADVLATLILPNWTTRREL